MTFNPELPARTSFSLDAALLNIRMVARLHSNALALQELEAIKASQDWAALELQRIRALQLQLQLLTGQARPVEAIAEASAMVDAAQASNQARWQVEAYFLQTAVHRGCGMRATALASAVAAVDLCERLGDELLLGLAVTAQAYALDFMAEAAKSFVAKWLAREPALPKEFHIFLYNVMGTAEFFSAEKSGDPQAYRRVIESHEQGLALAIKQGSPRQQAMQHMNVAISAAMGGDFDLAEVHLQDWDRLCELPEVKQEAPPANLCWTALCRGMVAIGRGKTDEGFALLLATRAQAQASRRSCLAPLIKIQEVLLKHAAAYAQGQFVAAWVDDLTRLHQEQGANIQALSAASFEELVKSAQASGENRILRSHGDTLTRELAASNQSLKDTVLELRTEVGRRERAEAELQKINEELELRVQQRTAELQTAQASIAAHERMAALSRLVSGLAHRLNTPLGNARMVVSGLGAACEQFEADIAKGLSKRDLQEFIDLTRQTGDLAERALKQAGELMRVFKQVSTLEHVEDAQRFDPGQALQECCDSMQEELKLQTVVPLHLELRDRPQCYGYLQVLAQVLKHLLANAMLHGQPESGSAAEPGVWITQEQQGERLQISVRDAGPGIEPDRLASIFEPFNNKLNASGLGLGLHIARNLVTDLLQGQLTVTSQPGQGSCFVLSLPLRVQE